MKCTHVEQNEIGPQRRHGLPEMSASCRCNPADSVFGSIPVQVEDQLHVIAGPKQGQRLVYAVENYVVYTAELRMRSVSCPGAGQTAYSWATWDQPR